MSGCGVKMVELPLGGTTTYGDPRKGGRSFIVSAGDRIVFDFVMALQVQIAQMNGLAPTPGLLQRFASNAQRRSDEVDAAVRARGVSADIRKLFAAKRKKQLQKHARSITLTQEQIVDLIKNCADLGFSHRAKHLMHEPEGRRLTDDDYADLSAGASTGERARYCVGQLFEERTHRSVHLFVNGGREWHIFFSSYRDTSGSPITGEHHWGAGAHVHYTSHLVAATTCEQTWESLDWTQYTVRNEHIRFREPNDGGGKERIVFHPGGKTFTAI
jgi:hypothetical protein